MQDSLPAGGLRLYREGVEPSGSLRKVSGYISILLSRTSPVARVVYAKRPFGGPEQVLDYLGRYTHRVAIANSRLVGLAAGRVSFRWKDYRHHDKQKVMTLAADEFIRCALKRDRAEPSIIPVNAGNPVRERGRRPPWRCTQWPFGRCAST
jgi:hypothetical protein